MKYALYPGCAAKGAAPELYQATQKVIDRLGIAVTELTDFNCCGAGVISEADPDLAYTLNARTLATAEKWGLNIMTLCGTCQGVLGAANKALQTDEALRERINKALYTATGLTYQGSVMVKHLQWILVKDFGLERLQPFITHPLTELSVAPFYGCYMLRPASTTGFDDWEDPSSLEKLIRGVGAQPVEYEGRAKCCGFPVFIEREEIALGMVGERIADAQKKGGEIMVTPCPLCHMSLDIYQSRAEEKLRSTGQADATLNMPILHLPQLLGLAMGFSHSELGMNRHLTATGAF